ncbi:MAG: hypothetical protein M3Y46_04940, partial [Actinomycetota bacterium]|nr:hypothetical protein [Actinomycetota bacterium]
MTGPVRRTGWSRWSRWSGGSCSRASASVSGRSSGSGARMSAPQRPGDVAAGLVERLHEVVD